MNYEQRREGRPRPLFRPTARHGRRHPRRQKGVKADA
jgi:hypothetical protein